MNKMTEMIRPFLLVLAVPFLMTVCSACKKAEPKPAIVRLELNTDPPEAEVMIKNREFEKKTPLKIKVKPGVYLVKFSKKGYKSQWRKIEAIPGNDKNFNFKLEKETASVMIISSPDSAAVTFEGRSLGVTPVVIRDLHYGKYQAEVTRHGFTRQTVSWNIDSPLPQLVEAVLDSNQGTLMIETKPSNAEVVIDGKTIGRTPFRDQVEEGKHQIELRRSGYVSLKKSVHIKRKEICRLDQLIMEIKPGSIQVKSNPPGAVIYINGKNYGDTPLKISNLKPGSYSIRVEKPGFDPAVRKVSLPPGENLDLKLNLDSNTGGVDVVTQPSGITLYLDGKMVGTTEKDPENKNISKIFKIRNISSGQHRLTIAHKRARPEKRNYNFKAQKGKIVRLTGLNLWIPNAVITRKDGNVETGRIVQDLPSKYEFEPSPGVKFTIEKSTVKNVEYLPETE